MSEPAIELHQRAERIERLACALKGILAEGSELALASGYLRRLHNEVSAWLVELEEPGRAA